MYFLFLFALWYCRRIVLCFKMQDNSLVIISHNKWLDAIFLSYYVVYVQSLWFFFRWNAFTFCRLQIKAIAVMVTLRLSSQLCLFLHFFMYFIIHCTLYLVEVWMLTASCVYISVIRVFVVGLLVSYQSHMCRPRLCQLQCYVLLFTK